MGKKQKMDNQLLFFLHKQKTITIIMHRIIHPVIVNPMYHVSDRPIVYLHIVMRHGCDYLLSYHLVQKTKNKQT